MADTCCASRVVSKASHPRETRGRSNSIFLALGSLSRAFLRSCELFSHVADLPSYCAARHRLNLDRTDVIFHRPISLASKLTNANGRDTCRQSIRERTTAVGPSKEEDFSHQILRGDIHSREYPRIRSTSVALKTKHSKGKPRSRLLT